MTTLWAQLEARAHDRPHDAALYDDAGTVLTFCELRASAERVAAGLHQLGIGPDSRVTWQLPTRLDTAVLSFALCRLGAVQNPVIHLYGQRELGFILRQTRAEWVIVTPRWRGIDFADRVRTLQIDLADPPRLLFADGTVGALPQGDPAILPPPPDRTTSPVRWIFYTSGTSAAPKGVCHTDASIIASGHALVDHHELTCDDVGSIAFPIAHGRWPAIPGIDAGGPAFPQC